MFVVLQIHWARESQAEVHVSIEVSCMETTADEMPIKLVLIDLRTGRFTKVAMCAKRAEVKTTSSTKLW